MIIHNRQIICATPIEVSLTRTEVCGTRCHGAYDVASRNDVPSIRLRPIPGVWAPAGVHALNPTPLLWWCFPHNFRSWMRGPLCTLHKGQAAKTLPEHIANSPNSSWRCHELYKVAIPSIPSRALKRGGNLSDAGIQRTIGHMKVSAGGCEL